MSPAHKAAVLYKAFRLMKIGPPIFSPEFDEELKSALAWATHELRETAMSKHGKEEYDALVGQVRHEMDKIPPKPEPPPNRIVTETGVRLCAKAAVDDETHRRIREHYCVKPFGHEDEHRFEER